ncbi:alpha/beta fold hydrolase [Knoellia koreensis]|uniref:Alpha/beta hydrolase n=1 Tax=Knoellia koreensis TaxID=2730921 RepID=A0A849HGJ2_9MICO|nr:alpha/beta hydrolase [Knoellia sp. DB2414S]NNM46309.1 alpha/beta hydrolase [Knoellia sp. DB2414S]
MPTADESATLTYRWAGPADPATPTIVLLHGLGDSGDCWPDAVRRWSPAHRVVGVDLLGHGRSPRFTPEQLTSADPMEQMYAAAEATVARIVADRGGPVAVVGHSMGGGVATALAARRPDLVAAAVLEDPAWRDPALRVQGPDVIRERLADVQAWHDDPDAQLAEGRRDNPTWPESEFGPWAESKTQVDTAFLALGVASLVAPWDELLASIRVPTLALLAGRGGPVTPDVRERAGRIDNPHLVIRVVPGSGHCIRRDVPDDYHALVDPFLARALTPADRVTSA